MSRLERGLLLDPDPRHAKIVERLLRAVVDQVERCDAVPDPRSLADALLVVNFDAIDASARAQLLSAPSAAPVVLCSRLNDRAALADLFGSAAVHHVVAVDPETDGDQLSVALQKLARGDIFGVEKYLSWGAKTSQRELRSSQQRDAALAELREVGIGAGVQPRLMEQMCIAADELITNAFYNAPIDEHRAHRFATQSRTVPVELAGDERIQLRFACDGRRFGLSVCDPFGSLGVDTVLRYLSKCLRQGEDQIDAKEGGAGLGLYYVFESLSQFVVNVAPGERTEMIALVDMRRRFRDFASEPKSFHLFVAEGP